MLVVQAMLITPVIIFLCGLPVSEIINGIVYPQSVVACDVYYLRNASTGLLEKQSQHADWTSLIIPL